jgi:CRP-like cAMP-binding protein
MLTVYYGFAVPYAIFFEHDDKEKASMDPKTVVEIIFSLMFAFDLMLNFFTAYQESAGPRKGLLVTDKPRIIRNYLSSWFALDVSSTLPWEYMIPSSLNVDPKIFKALRAIKLMRIARMTRLISRFQYRLKLNPAYLRLGVTVLGAVLFWHLLACGYWVISTAFGNGLGTDAWVPDATFEGEESFVQYGRCFMWAMTATTGMGFNIDPQNTLQTVMTIFSMLGGMFLVTMMIGSVSNALSNMDVQEAMKAQKEEQLAVYFMRKSVPQELQKRIEDYYEYMFAMHSANTGDLLSDLHESLRLNLSMCENRELSRKLPLFGLLEEITMVELVPAFKARIYLPEEIVFIAGDTPEALYAMRRGSVDCFDETAFKAFTLNEGAFFGHRGLLRSHLRRRYSVRSVDHSELLLLRKAHFVHMWVNFVDFRMAIEKFLPPADRPHGWQLVRGLVHRLVQARAYGVERTFDQILADFTAIPPQRSTIDVDMCPSDAIYPAVTQSVGKIVLPSRFSGGKGGKARVSKRVRGKVTPA